MIYLIVLTFNWEPDAIIKLKQLSKVKQTHLKKNLEKKLKNWREKPNLEKTFFPE